MSESQQLHVVARTTYPDDEGLIAMAWEKGPAVVTDLPSDRSHWNSHNIDRYGMSEASVTHLTMQSRSLVGLRLDAPGPSRPVGLVVLESLTPRGAHGRIADELASSDTYDLLTQIMIEVVRCLDEDDVALFRERLPD